MTPNGCAILGGYEMLEVARQEEVATDLTFLVDLALFFRNFFTSESVFLFFTPFCCCWLILILIFNCCFYNHAFYCEPTRSVWLTMILIGSGRVVVVCCLFVLAIIQINSNFFIF